MSVSTDLWAAGFSDDEDQPGQDGNSDLDILASLVDDGGGGEGSGRGGEGGDGGREGSTATPQKVVTTFEECLVKPDEVALMKGKLYKQIAL